MRRRVAGPREASTAQAIDPLSWFTAPFAPLAFGGVILLLGSSMIVTGESDAATLVVQLLALAVCTSACVLIHVATRPKRGAIGWRTSSLALLVSLCGYLLSALNFGADGQRPEQWWAPGAVALAIASLAPYVSIRRLAVLGLATSIAVGAVGCAAYPAGSGPWSAGSVVIMVMTTPLLAVAASSVFIVTVVRTMRRLLAERTDVARVPADDSASAVSAHSLARLTARVTPFLERLAETGTVTPTDRAVAGQLARRLRDELVTSANASWLDTLAMGRPVVVMDPERRADVMNAAQRSALTGLLSAILDSPETASKAILVELRGRDGGATAVAVSMDLELPEGRRTMHLAPYYLTLKTAFEGLSWSEGNLMSMRFEVPATDTSNG
ncbi:hypothetical protein [Parafrigoribacterium soli]|uniref:hypothetical protein n=1 Tax=Parafrigoribacterium soli TaxID=3144663 RepID=UPI0032EB1FFC